MIAMVIIVVVAVVASVFLFIGRTRASGSGKGGRSGLPHLLGAAPGHHPRSPDDRSHAPWAQSRRHAKGSGTP